MENLAEIRRILEMYYNGETSLKEEKLLSEYFSSNDVPQELIHDKELFQSFSSDKDSIHFPKDLDQKIISSIELAERNANLTRRIGLFSLSGLAAGLLVMIAVYLFYLNNDTPSLLATDQMTDTYSDPQVAYEQVRKTMTYVSSKLNNGTNELIHVKQISHAAESIQSLSKVNKGSRELSLLVQLRKARDIEIQ